MNQVLTTNSVEAKLFFLTQGPVQLMELVLA